MYSFYFHLTNPRSKSWQILCWPLEGKTKIGWLAGWSYKTGEWWVYQVGKKKLVIDLVHPPPSLLFFPSFPLPSPIFFQFTLSLIFPNTKEIHHRHSYHTPTTTTTLFHQLLITNQNYPTTKLNLKLFPQSLSIIT